jgi:hypothetical protein
MMAANDPMDPDHDNASVHGLGGGHFDAPQTGITLMKTKALKFITILVLLAVLGIACLYTTSLSYPYCLVMESSWMKAKTQRELEARLFAFYQRGRIDPARTVWKTEPLANGQTVFRYLIFGKERLDVMVANDGTITDIFSAYE